MPSEAKQNETIKRQHLSCQELVGEIYGLQADVALG